MRKSKTNNSIENIIEAEVENLSLDDKVKKLNEIKRIIHKLSPFKNEPVDCVLWVKGDSVAANDGLGLTQPKSEAYEKYLSIKKIKNKALTQTE